MRKEKAITAKLSSPRPLLRGRHRRGIIRAPAESDPARQAADLIRRADAEHAACRELEAAEILERALAIDPGSLDARRKLAVIRANSPRGPQDLEAVLRLAREILVEQPGWAEGHKLAASACLRLDDRDGLRRHIGTILDLLPEDASDRAFWSHALTIGRLADGDLAAFAEHARWEDRQTGRAAWIDALGPMWAGEPLAGKTIMLHTQCDGFGDSWQMARYIPGVKARGARVLMACDPSMTRLFAGSGGGLGLDLVIPISAAALAHEMAAHDFHLPLMNLPAVLGLAAERDIPADVPYLTPDPGAVEHWRPAVEEIPGFRVGIAWQGDPRHPQDRIRSFRLAELAPLAEVPGVSLASLQKGHGLEQLAGAGFPVADLGPGYHAGDWLDTAAIVAGLDLVVTLDSAIAHLAGALGKPVWLALSRPAEWRWMRDRDDSPWYPTMKLFRQERPGEWGQVFRRMAEALGPLAKRSVP